MQEEIRTWGGRAQLEIEVCRGIYVAMATLDGHKVS